MGVPKAAMDHDRDASPRQRHVRSAGDTSELDAESIPQTVE